MNRKLLFAIVFILSFKLVCAQNIQVTDSVEIKKIERINFLSGDSIFQYSHFVGRWNMDFIPKFWDNKDSVGQVKYHIESGRKIKTKLVLINEIQNVNSRFNILCIDTSKLNVNYELSNKSDFDLRSWDVKYSLLLKNFNQNALEVDEIRIIFPSKPNLVSSLPTSWFVKLNKANGELEYGEGKYNEYDKFEIISLDSIILKPNDIIRIEKEIGKIDVQNEKYFAHKGVGVHWRYLIEFHENGKYYAFEKADLNPYDKKNQFKRIRKLLEDLASEN